MSAAPLALFLPGDHFWIFRQIDSNSVSIVKTTIAQFWCEQPESRKYPDSEAIVNYHHFLER